MSSACVRVVFALPRGWWSIGCCSGGLLALAGQIGGGGGGGGVRVIWRSERLDLRAWWF